MASSGSSSFTIGNALSVGWQKMKENFLLFLYIMLVFIALQFIMSLSDKIDAGFLILAAAGVVWMILSIGTIGITLGVVDNKPVKFQDIYSKPSLFPDYLIATVLYALIIIGGLILLVVPGIIWAVKFSFYSYYIVDKKMGPIDALKASAKATYGHKWDLFLFWLAIIGINIVGALALLIGLFATVPTSHIACAFAYRKIDAEQPQNRSDKLAGSRKPKVSAEASPAVRAASKPAAQPPVKPVKAAKAKRAKK